MDKHHLHKTGYLFFLNLSIITLLLMALTQFDIIVLWKFLTETLLFSALVVFIGASILFKFKLNELRHTHSKSLSSFFHVAPYFFLAVLIILAINQFAKLEFITLRNFHLTVIGIFFGFFAFYSNRDRIEHELEDEKKKEEEKEKERAEDFEYRFPRINSIWGLRSIVKWMYKEGWAYSLGLIGIVAVGFVLRVWNLNYIDGLDNFTVNAIKNYYENGVNYYRDSLFSFSLMKLIVNVFGYNIASLRMISVAYSILTIFVIYILAKKINKNVALVSSSLFVISPWSIIISRITRDYPFDLLIFCVYLVIAFNLLEKNDKLKSLIKLSIFTLFLIAIIVINGRTQTLIFLFAYPIFCLFFCISIMQKNRLIKVLFPILLIVFFIFNFSDFKLGLRWNSIFLKYLFSPITLTPWQWFNHGSLSSIAIIAIFLLSSILIIKKPHRLKNNKIFQIITIFIVGLAIFVLKFYPHANDFPTRYIYYLFGIYCIILANSFYNIYKFGKLGKIVLFVILILFFNVNLIKYAVNPTNYSGEFVTESNSLKIDSIGVGRFELYPLVNYINELNVLKENKTLVLSGRFAELIQLLNYSMDGNRYLHTANCDVCSRHSYDVGKNMFVESKFWNIHELDEAIQKTNEAYFITEEYCLAPNSKSFIVIDDGCALILRDSDFYYEKTTLKFVDKVQRFRIYYWNRNISN